MSSHQHPRLPVRVLAGFLGSGKTTPLHRLFTQEPHAATLINEFGKVPLDQLIERENIPLVTLLGGCLCCQVRGAFAPVHKNL